MGPLGRCPVCRYLWVLKANGTVRKHSCFPTDDLWCCGSWQRPTVVYLRQFDGSLKEVRDA